MYIWTIQLVIIMSSSMHSCEIDTKQTCSEASANFCWHQRLTRCGRSVYQSIATSFHSIRCQWVKATGSKPQVVTYLCKWLQTATIGVVLSANRPFPISLSVKQMHARFVSRESLELAREMDLCLVKYTKTDVQTWFSFTALWSCTMVILTV